MKNKINVIFLTISAVLLIAGGYMVWLFLSKPTPEEAAATHIRKLVSGDIDWIYEHMPEEEKRMPAMRKEILKEFYDTFLKEKLKGCEIIPSQEARFAHANKGSAGCTLKLSDGSEINVGTWAVVEDGKILVSAVETLMQFASVVVYYDKGTTHLDRIKYGWKHFSPWFVERGINKFYSLQSGSFWPLKEEK